MENKIECKCCHNLTIDEDELFDICDVCGWQRDAVQEENPDYKGGANKMSLNEARQAYQEYIKQQIS